MSFLTDASDQTAEHNDAMRAELTDDRDAYLDEFDAEEFERRDARHREWWT